MAGQLWWVVVDLSWGDYGGKWGDSQGGLAGGGEGTGLAVGGLAVVVDVEAEVGRRVDAVIEVEFIGVTAIAGVFDDGEMEMGANRIGSGAIEVTGVAEEGATFDEEVTGARGEGWLDEVGVGGAVAGHVGVVEPYLSVWLEGVVGDTLDEGATPIGFASDVAIGGGVDRGEARVGVTEDVDALMGATGGVWAAGVGVEETDEAFAGEEEGGLGAGVLGGGDELGAGGVVAAPPAVELLVAGVGGGSVEVDELP